MTTCYGEQVTDPDTRRTSRTSRPLTPADAAAVRDAQLEVEAAERKLRSAVHARNELFRTLRAKGIMATEMGRAAATDEYPQGLHRTVVQRILRER